MRSALIALFSLTACSPETSLIAITCKGDILSSKTGERTKETRDYLINETEKSLRHIDSDDVARRNFCLPQAKCSVSVSKHQVKARSEQTIRTSMPAPYSAWVGRSVEDFDLSRDNGFLRVSYLSTQKMETGAELREPYEISGYMNCERRSLPRIEEPKI